MSEEKTTDTSNNETGEETGVSPEDLYDDKGGDSKGDKSTDGKDADDKDVDKLGDDKESEKEVNKEGDDKDVVPEKYDLKIAEDSLLDQNDVDDIVTRAKELELSNEEAQDLMNLESDAINRYQDKLDKNVSDIQAGWLKSAETDKEIGGEAFKENVEMAKRVLDKYGSKELATLLDDSSLGNHAEVIRVFSRIGKLMAEDQAVFSKEHGSAEKTMEETFYGNSKDN